MLVVKIRYMAPLYQIKLLLNMVLITIFSIHWTWCVQKNRVIFGRFLHIRENVEWPRFYWTTRYMITRGRVLAGPSFHLGTLSTRIALANLLGACDFRDNTKVPLSRDLWPRPWPWRWAHPECRLTWGPLHASLVANGDPVIAVGNGNYSADRQTDRHDLPQAILPEPS